MKIAILVSELPPHGIGGTETQSLRMAGRLASKHEVTVLTRSVKGLPRRETRDGFRIRRFRHFRSPLGFISQALFSLNEIRKIRKDVDVLQCMMIRPNGFIGYLARKLLGVRYSVWLRGEYRHYGKGSFPGSVLVRKALSNADVILAQTGSIREEVREDYPDKRIEVVRNGVDFPEERASGESVVFVGNLIERKGVHNLINALRELDREGFRPRTILVGDGRLRKDLEAMAKGLNVEFRGRVLPGEVGASLREGAVLVLPSVVGKGEGLPNVILEAMAMGLPSIASGIAGIPDVIQEGKTGFLVEPGDHRAIARRLRQILEDRPLREDMSRACLRERERYSWDSVIKELERIYSGIR